MPDRDDLLPDIPATIILRDWSFKHQVFGD